MALGFFLNSGQLKFLDLVSFRLVCLVFSLKHNFCDSEMLPCGGAWLTEEKQNAIRPLVVRIVQQFINTKVQKVKMV